MKLNKVLFLMSAMLVLTLGSCSNKKQLSELKTQEIVLQKNYDTVGLASSELYEDVSTALACNYYSQLALADNDFDKIVIQRKINHFEKADSLKNEYFSSKTKVSKY
jgi:hypothetical protein